MPKKLFILDLDNTLIYGSYAQEEKAKLIFAYSEYLKVYVRKYARELIKKCESLGDIIVYTTAKKDYAEKICIALKINYKILLSRSECEISPDNYEKKINSSWEIKYKEIAVIDDTPSVWTEDTWDKATVLVPSNFMGEKDDIDLKRIINLI